MERCFSTGNIAAVDDGGDLIGLNLGGERLGFGGDLAGFGESGDGGDETAEGGVVAVYDCDVCRTVCVFGYIFHRNLNLNLIWLRNEMKL